MKETNVALSSRDAKKLTVAVLGALFAYGIFLVASPLLLLRAAENGSDAGVEFLLGCGARPDFGSLGAKDIGNSPLLETTRRGHWIAAKHLIGRGADINFTDHNGNSPLRYAAYGAKADIVQLLISRGANVNPNVDRQSAPIVCALLGDDTSGQRLRTVGILLKAGADPCKESWPGFAVAVAKENVPQAVPLLVAAGAKP